MKKFESLVVPEDMHLELALVSGEVADERRSWPVEPKDENAPYVFQFLVKNGTSLEEAMHAAAVEYLQSDAGRGKYYGKNDDEMAELDGEAYDPFGIKELWNDVPDGILEKHGLRRLFDGRGVPMLKIYVDEPVTEYADAWEGYQSDYEKNLDEEG